MKRVAAVITNYNMPERTDALVEYIQAHVKSPLDVVVVDNGSDLTEPSKYTTVFLKENKQTTGGWLAGLRSLSRTYFGYWFLITSAEFTVLSKDPLTPMVQKLKEDKGAVGVHNALTEDSTTAWKHLLTRGGTGCRRTWMIDNISSLYRAQWFDSIGMLDPRFTYGWGIDLETCYKARQQGRSLWICEDAKVKKVTDIGYAMERMNMGADDRRKLASDNMAEVMTLKHGDDWYYKMFGAGVMDNWK